MEEEILSQINLDLISLHLGVVHLIDWISEQPHLPNITDENLLKAFIIGCKAVERAKIKLDNYFSARAKQPLFFNNRDPIAIEWNRAMRVGFLKELTTENYNVILMRMPRGREERQAFSLAETFRLCFMVIDEELRRRPITAGQVAIIDLKDTRFSILTKCSPRLISDAINSYQKAYPIRLKHCIWINAPPIFAGFYNRFLKYFYSQKIRERIYIHTEDHTVLSKYIPLEILPSDYGGMDEPLDAIYERTKHVLKSNRNWFLNEGILTSDETKRQST